MRHVTLKIQNLYRSVRSLPKNNPGSGNSSSRYLLTYILCRHQVKERQVSETCTDTIPNYLHLNYHSHVVLRVNTNAFNFLNCLSFTYLAVNCVKLYYVYTTNVHIFTRVLFFATFSTLFVALAWLAIVNQQKALSTKIFYFYFCLNSGFCLNSS